MQKEPEGTVVCKDHPEHLDHPGRSLDLKRLKASVAHRFSTCQTRSQQQSSVPVSFKVVGESDVIRFILLACDGLFKVFTPEEAVTFILSCLE
ncbi:hypothetical protein STEG23_003218, partial [Scotinomys teguina]